MAAIAQSDRPHCSFHVRFVLSLIFRARTTMRKARLANAAPLTARPIFVPHGMVCAVRACVYVRTRETTMWKVDLFKCKMEHPLNALQRHLEVDVTFRFAHFAILQ